MSVAVVGGGVAGLAAAHRLVRAGADVVLLEQAERCGGKVRGAELDGVGFDVGAESMLLRGRPAVSGLLTELGLDDRLVRPTAARPAILAEGRPVGVPRSLMGVPADLESLRPLLSSDGWRRAAEEPSRPAPPVTQDVAIGQLVADRFGPEVTDRLLEPLLGGVYAGRSRELSTAAVNPRLWELARTGGSLLHGAAAAMTASSGGSPFTGLDGGVHQLVDALVAALGERIRTGTTVSGLTRSGTGWRLTTSTSSPTRPVDHTGHEVSEQHEVDAVVLAVPAPAAARLLTGTAAAAPLAGIGYASPAVLALRVAGVEPTGSGLLVPPGGLPQIKAVTHAGAKWDWVGARTAAAWGTGDHLVRVSLGRRGEESLLQRSDEQLLAAAGAELATLPGWRRVQVRSGLVQRWGDGLPQYAVGHLDRVVEIETAVASLPRLAVCGAAYRGVGVGPCLDSGLRAADLVTAG